MIKPSKIQILLDLDIPFAIGVGDLFGMMDWFLIIHSREHRVVKTGWLWNRSDCYVDVWTLGLNSEEVVEFREKYIQLFCRNVMKNIDGVVYERKGVDSFRDVYKLRRNARKEYQSQQYKLRKEEFEKGRILRQLRKKNKKNKK